MSHVWFPQCYWYRHFHVQTVMASPRTCDAFPDGLPSDIFEGYFDHRMPYHDDNDHGIQFEEQPDKQALPDFLQAMTDDVLTMIRRVMNEAMEQKIQLLRGKPWHRDLNREE